MNRTERSLFRTLHWVHTGSSNPSSEPLPAGSRSTIPRGVRPWSQPLTRGLLATALVFLCPGQSCVQAPSEEQLQVAGYQPEPPSSPAANSSSAQPDTAVELSVAVDAGGNSDVVEGDLVTLHALTSVTSGNLRYSWSQVGGTPVELSAIDRPTVTLVAPTPAADTEKLTFAVAIERVAAGTDSTTASSTPAASNTITLRVCRLALKQAKEVQFSILDPSTEDPISGGTAPLSCRFAAVTTGGSPLPDGQYCWTVADATGTVQDCGVLNTHAQRDWVGSKAGVYTVTLTLVAGTTQFDCTHRESGTTRATVTVQDALAPHGGAGGLGVDATAPTLSSVQVRTSLTVDVTFSEAMGAGVTTPTNYTVSGTGKGTLTDNPGSVALVSGNTYRLTWTAGDMVSGGDITITAANVKDSAGNKIGTPASGTHAHGGIEPTPTVAVTSPKDSQKLPTSSITVTGTAAASGRPGTSLAIVEVRVNSGSWQSATGTTSWTAPVTLAPGSNTIEARSKDDAGHYSPISSPVTVNNNQSMSLAFAGSALSLAMNAIGSGYTLTDESTGYAVSIGSVISKIHPTPGTPSEYQSRTITAIPGGYRATYLGSDATVDFSVQNTAIGIRLSITGCHPDDATQAGCGSVDLFIFDDFPMDPDHYTLPDVPLVRLSGGFVLAALPLTYNTAVFARADAASRILHATSPDPSGKIWTGGGAFNRNQGVYLVLCKEAELPSKLAAVELELGIRTATLGGYLAKQHPYNNQDYLFLLSDVDANGVKVSADEIIALCRRMGLKQVMLGAWLWYDSIHADSPFHLLPGITNTISSLKAAGISTVAHSYIRPADPTPGTWWGLHAASIIQCSSYYVADIQTDLIETYAPLYAQAVMNAGFDGIYWDGSFACQATIPGEADGRTFRAMFDEFYAHGYYPKIVQCGEAWSYYYVTRTGQTDLWEGWSETSGMPRWVSVAAFLDGLSASDTRNSLLTPDLGWWGQVHMQSSQTDRYATRDEWTRLAAKSLAENIPIGYRTRYNGHMADPDRLFVEQTILNTVEARALAFP